VTKLSIKNVNAADGIVATDTADTASHLVASNMKQNMRSRVVLNKFIETLA
jgi:hypothetical protein